MADESGFDLALLEDFAGQLPGEETDTGSSEDLPDLDEPTPPVEPLVEPEPPKEPEPKEEPAPAGAEVADEFDYSTPLNPREQALLARLQEKTGETLELRGQASTSTEPPTTTIAPEEVDFLSGTNLDDAFATPEGFNKLLNTVYNKALERASVLAAENVMRTLPATISGFVTQHAERVRMVDDFYTANPDLEGVRSIVADVANEISANHPEFTLQQVFDQTATKTREVLKMKARPPRIPSTKLAGQTTRKPNIPTQGGRSPGRFTEPELDGLAREVNELLVDV